MKLIYTLLEVVETKKNDKYIIYPDFQGIDNPTKIIDGINRIIDVADAIGNEQNKDYTYFRYTEKKDYIDNMIKDAKNDGWKNFEPIVAIEHPLIPGKFCVVDGNHRLGAFKIGKIPKIKATIISNDHILLALPGSIYKKDISPKTIPFKNAKGKIDLKKYFNTKQLSETIYDYEEGRNVSPHRLDFDTQKLMDAGAIIICKAMEGDPNSPNYKKHLNTGGPNLITLLNIKKADKDSWILDAIKHPLEKAPTVYKNVSLETSDGKYNQILWSLDKLKIPYENMLKDNPTQDKMEMTERCWKGYTQKGMKTMFGKRYPNCVKAS